MSESQTKLVDPFLNHPPLYSPAFKAILRGLELALKQRQSVEDDLNYAGLRRVIGGTGQGQGKERSDKPTGSQRENLIAKAPGHYSLFCTHEVPYWRPCTKCGRDKAAAEKNISIVLKSVRGLAFYTK